MYIKIGWKNLNIPLGRLERRWKDNINTDLREIGLEVVYGMNLAHDTARWRIPVNAVMNLRVL
jgi:hypothetical protein